MKTHHKAHPKMKKTLKKADPKMKKKLQKANPKIKKSHQNNKGDQKIKKGHKKNNKGDGKIKMKKSHHKKNNKGDRKMKRCDEKSNNTGPSIIHLAFKGKRFLTYKMNASGSWDKIVHAKEDDESKNHPSPPSSTHSNALSTIVTYHHTPPSPESEEGMSEEDILMAILLKDLERIRPCYTQEEARSFTFLMKESLKIAAYVVEKRLANSG